VSSAADAFVRLRHLRHLRPMRSVHLRHLRHLRPMRSVHLRYLRHLRPIHSVRLRHLRLTAPERSFDEGKPLQLSRSMPMSRRDKLLVAWRASSDVLGRVAILLLTVAAARRLSIAAFGLFALGTTLGWLGSVLSDAGMQMHLARRVAQAPGDAWPLLMRWLSWRAACSGLVLTATGLALTALGVEAWASLLWLTAGGLLTGLVELTHHAFRGLERSDLESAIGASQRVGSLAAGAAALYWSPSLALLAVVLSVPPLGALAVSLVAARRVMPMVQPARTNEPGGRQDTWGEFVGEVAPIGVGILLSALYFRIDMVLIGLWVGATAVGLYGAVYRIVDALRLFPAAALAVALPSLCRATDLRAATALAVPLTVGAALVSLVCGWLATALVPSLFGPEFGEAVSAFRALLVAFPLMTLNYVLTQQLVGWNRQRAFAVLAAAALAVNVGLNAWLIPQWGIVGAAWTTVATEAMLTAGCAACLLEGR
jgi:O-antigen/teichoic acid export membrane protein